jgi:putative glycosyltransferase
MSPRAAFLSIVTSMYGSAPFLNEFHARCVAAAPLVADAFEIVFVNDGSPDESLGIALGLRQHDPRVRVVDLSRNFGHHTALMIGLERARGDRVFLIDCDLEEDPGWLPAFCEALDRTGADVVYGVQERRKGRVVERLSGWLFYNVFNRFLSTPIPENVVTVRLMTRRYVRALVSHQEREVCLAGLWAITGFDQRPFTVQKGSRGTPSYGLRRRISALVNAITSFSNRPLIYIFEIGVAVMALSIVAAVFLVYRHLTNGIGVAGWASVMVSLWFLGGLTIFCLGIIGIYLAKVFTETKQRPYAIVRAEYGCEAGEPQ